ncbi:DUF4249 domain-containing protein [Carboxylicivirga mesophila]|uniref:DUF4249 domain-containing protein n=1 Tax=Carboxylicivirga mesophila TaxID=1166478 RepID=A0ABS5KFA7_9BACT|nr:DUF4249 domain-containing protein [Carboxylicivirga mesophila]MBS2213744.1 DUF4249 domain-containing protein [Carboxylicivirga mesophila]
MRIAVILILTLLLACSKDIELEQVNYEPKIVVDGWIENGRTANVLLTMSSPFLTDYDSASIRNTFLNYAKVTITTGKGESEVLTLTRQKEFFPPFVYKSIAIKGEVGETYTLEVVYRDKIVEAATSIPTLPDVREVVTEPVSDTSMVIFATVNDDALNENYYYSQIFTWHYDTRFHPSDNPLKNDRFFNGQMHTFQVKRSDQPDPLNIYNINSDRNIMADEFAITDTVSVKISQLDKEAYEVLNGIYIDHLSQSSPFTFVDQKTHTNIKGGIGRWTGMATRQFLVYNKKPRN